MVRCIGRNSHGMPGATLASKRTVTLRSSAASAGASARPVVPP